MPNDPSLALAQLISALSQQQQRRRPVQQAAPQQARSQNAVVAGGGGGQGEGGGGGPGFGELGGLGGALATAFPSVIGSSPGGILGGSIAGGGLQEILEQVLLGQAGGALRGAGSPLLNTGLFKGFF